MKAKKKLKRHHKYYVRAKRLYDFISSTVESYQYTEYDLDVPTMVDENYKIEIINKIIFHFEKIEKEVKK